MDSNKTRRKHTKSYTVIILLFVMLAAGAAAWYIYDTNYRNKTPDEPGVACMNVSEKEVCGDPYIGMSEEEAIKKANQDGVPSRVVKRDDQEFILDTSIDKNRLNFVVKDGKVISARFY